METVADTTLRHLGGQRFLAMTGAQLARSGSELQVRLKRPCKVQVVSILLEPNDTYTVRAFKVARSGLYCREVGAFSLVYADDLRGAFEKLTGLYTSLGTCGASLEPKAVR